MSRPSGPILLCYDGSEDAAAAIDAVGPQFTGRQAVVACFWQPFAPGRRFAVRLLEVVQHPPEINAREAERAQNLAEQGAAIARAAGMPAEGRAIAVSRPIDEAIIAYAEEVDAPTIVLGSRGRSSIGSLLLGDVAHDVVQRSTRMVVVVPSARLSGRRRGEPADHSADD
jgi:nucleotide-binding universal stress UspA family protein